MPQGKEPRLESGTVQDSREFAAESAGRFSARLKFHSQVSAQLRSND